MEFGAAEDVVRSPDLPSAKAKMTLLRLAGIRAVRVTSLWVPGRDRAERRRARDPDERRRRRAALGVKVYLSVYPGLER